MRCPYLLFLMLFSICSFGAEYHVSVNGNDKNDGTLSKPFKTISAAAAIAQPGDTITVHSGTYRERVIPPRGGESDSKRIVYRAAPGEEVVIKGSEIITGWKKVANGIWMAVIPDSLFHNYNPYKEVLHGDWFTSYGRIYHTGEVYLNGKSLFEADLMEGVFSGKPNTDIPDTSGSKYTWHCESDEKNTYIYGNFHQYDPNKELVEINIRPACFYPDSTGINYITVQGFRMCQAATRWAAPTAEQIGVIGTFWSKGWIIENNIVSDSKCAGITLGKDKKSGDNIGGRLPCEPGPKSYNEVVDLALKNGWSKDRIGHHIVRNNTIFNCEQAGICGSLGAAFSTIANNHIYNICVKGLYGGSEIATIKIHAAIDVLIEHNRLHNAPRGIWLDWMAQGMRVTSNLFYSNNLDLLMEVNHGPYLVDNNIFLSAVSIYDDSESGAYVQNLITGRMRGPGRDVRHTPFFEHHSTVLAGRRSINGGDNRFYNNIFSGYRLNGNHKEDEDAGNRYGLRQYESVFFPVQADGNIYLKNAERLKGEINFIEKPLFNPSISIVEKDDSVMLTMTLDPSFKSLHRKLVTTVLLGKAIVPYQSFEHPDGSPYTIDADYFGNKRNKKNPFPGPIECIESGRKTWRVW